MCNYFCVHALLITPSFSISHFSTTYHYISLYITIYIISSLLDACLIISSHFPSQRYISRTFFLACFLAFGYNFLQHYQFTKRVNKQTFPTQPTANLSSTTESKYIFKGCPTFFLVPHQWILVQG